MKQCKRKRFVIAVVVVLFLLTLSGVAAQSLPSPTILAAVWSPDGSKLAVAGTEGLRVIDVASGQELSGFQVAAPPVYAVTWSPDGNKLASSGEDKLINIWDATNGTLITSLAGHDFSRLADMAWSPDGTRLASAAATIDDFTLRTWDVVNYLPLAQFDASALAEVVWSSDGSQLIVANTIIGVYIFPSSLAISNTSRIQEYGIGPMEPIGSIALHSDGTTLAMGSFYQPVIYLWDIATNRQIGILQGHTDSVLAMAWRPGTDTLASVSLDGTLRTWDAASGQQIDVIDVGAKLYTVDWSPDGSRLVYGGETPDGQTEILKTIQFPIANAGPDQTVTDSDSSGSELVTFDGSGSTDSDGTIVSYPWIEDGVEIATGVGPQVELAVGVHTITLTVTDNDGATDTDDVVITVEGPPSAGCTSSIAAGDVLGLVSATDAANATVDHDAFSLVAAQDNARVVSEIAWKPDGSVFAVEYLGGTVELRDGTTGELQRIIDVRPPHISLDFLTWHPTANLLLNDSTGLYLWDFSADVSYDLGAIAGDNLGGMRSVFWDAEGERVIAFDGYLVVWDVQTLPPQFLFAKRTDREIYAAEWNPTRTVVATRALGDVFLRDPINFEWFAATTLSGDGVLAWSPDGQWLAASGWSGMVRTWNVATGEFQQERVIQANIFEQNPYPFNTTLALQFSADGTELLSVDLYGTFKKWDASTGQLLQITQLTDEPLHAAAFSPDGAQIAYGLESGGVEMIDTPSPSDCTQPSPY